MRTVFIGAVQFSRDALIATLAARADVVGVCTLESSPANADHVDLSVTCREHGIACRYTPDVNADDVIAWIRALRPDVIFCFGWSFEYLLSLHCGQKDVRQIHFA